MSVRLSGRNQLRYLYAPHRIHYSLKWQVGVLVSLSFDLCICRFTKTSLADAGAMSVSLKLFDVACCRESLGIITDSALLQHRLANPCLQIHQLHIEIVDLMKVTKMLPSYHVSNEIQPYRWQIDFNLLYWVRQSTSY